MILHYDTKWFFFLNFLALNTLKTKIFRLIFTLYSASDLICGINQPYFRLTAAFSINNQSVFNVFILIK